MGRGFKSLTAHDPIFAGVAELADALDLGSGALKFADMAELADAIDLGSIVNRRAGSSPVIRIL